MAASPVGPTPAMETTPSVETTSESAAVKSAPESVGLSSPVETAQALLAQLSGLMPLVVLGRRPAEAGPVPAPSVFLPVARAVPTEHAAVATRIHVGSAEAPPSGVPDVTAKVIPGDVHVVAPVVVYVHVTDAVPRGGRWRPPAPGRAGP